MIALVWGLARAMCPRRVPNSVVLASSSTSMIQGMWLDWINGYRADSIAVVNIPRGFSRINSRRVGMSCSAWMARRYMVRFTYEDKEEV